MTRGIYDDLDLGEIRETKKLMIATGLFMLQIPAAPPLVRKVDFVSFRNGNAPSLHDTWTLRIRNALPKPADPALSADRLTRLVRLDRSQRSRWTLGERHLSQGCPSQA